METAYDIPILLCYHWFWGDRLGGLSLAGGRLDCKLQVSVGQSKTFLRGRGKHKRSRVSVRFDPQHMGDKEMRGGGRGKERERTRMLGLLLDSRVQAILLPHFLSSWHCSCVPLNPAVALLNFTEPKFKIFFSFLKEIFLCMIWFSSLCCNWYVRI